jgi:hypothetical protein
MAKGHAKLVRHIEIWTLPDETTSGNWKHCLRANHKLVRPRKQDLHFDVVQVWPFHGIQNSIQLPR